MKSTEQLLKDFEYLQTQILDMKSTLDNLKNMMDVVKCQDFLLRDLCGLLRDSFLMNEDLRIKKVSRYPQENESKEEN